MFYIGPIDNLRNATIGVETRRQAALRLNPRHRNRKIKHMFSIVIRKTI